MIIFTQYSLASNYSEREREHLSRTRLRLSRLSELSKYKLQTKRTYKYNCARVHIEEARAQAELHTQTHTRIYDVREFRKNCVCARDNDAVVFTFARSRAAMCVFR